MQRLSLQPIAARCEASLDTPTMCLSLYLVSVIAHAWCCAPAVTDVYVCACALSTPLKGYLLACAVTCSHMCYRVEL